ARRVAMAAPDRPGYFRDLVGELRGGAVVTVRGDHPAPAGSPRGRFLGRPTAFARGAPTLALRAGAELVTARVIRVGSCCYRLTVEPPIELSREDRDHFLAAAVAEFAGRLERNALAFPSDWEGWLWLQELVATEPARVDAAAQSGSGSRGGAVGGVI
ncbi:MAG: hypothetical protein R3190_16020, partial [Thermoanaerobaculia bacterium]|nr:hypothetical protein [Thermoanaerobaculia bacterium]